jgi:16S rRNA (cytosine1402-N4)-methyltransferase
MSSFHNPVMPKETMQFLDVKKGAWYIDCNLGGGGHTEEILKRGGRVLGIDLDPDAIFEVANNHNLTIQKENDSLQAISDDLILIQTNFSNIKEVSKKFLNKPVSGILFDLGVSSYQLETPQRGFSFNTNANLDMRMNPTIGVKASDLLNALPEKELARMFWEYGEENFSRPIAKKIVEYRQKKKIETTDELANIILSIRHRTPGDRTHPATRIFQALRIAVNDELHSLEEALPQALQVLQPQGRLLVISFHSLEDRIVKNFMKSEEEKCSITIITQKPFEPTEEEIIMNPRSRSGKLRVAEKN